MLTAFYVQGYSPLYQPNLVGGSQREGRPETGGRGGEVRCWLGGR